MPQTGPRVPRQQGEQPQGLLVTSEQLGQLLNLNDRYVRELATKGLLVRAKKPNQGKYELIASVRTYVTHLRESAAGRQGSNGLSATEENSLLKRATRERLERLNQVEADKLISLEEIEQAGADVLLAIQGLVMQFPDMVSAECPELDTLQIEKVRKVAREVLELASVRGWANDPGKMPVPLRKRINERQGIAD